METAAGTPSLGRALDAVVAKSDLPLSAGLAPFRAPNGSSVLAIVLGITQPVDATPSGARREQLTLTARAFGPEDGKPKGSTGGTLDLTINGQSDTPITYEASMRLPLSPGRYALRLGAATRDGVSGTILPTIEIPDFARERLSLSGLVVTTSPSPGVLLRETLADLVPVSPTARREFTSRDDAWAFVRIYQGGDSTIAPVDVLARIADTNDNEVESKSRTFPTAAFGSLRSADYVYALPLDSLAPGEYLLRIIATAGKDLGERTMRFRVR
jgi:hypothetical protein